jgi:TPR repeat protein
MLSIRIWIMGVAFLVIGLLAAVTVPDLLRGDYFELCMKFSRGEGFRGQGRHFVDRARCVKWAAERGDVFRQFELGTWYADGLNVSQDHSEAVRWWRRAAQAGFAPAQLRLADSYFEGRGVEQDHQGAAHWYRRAAEQGAPLAWLRLAFMYEHGLGIEQDDFIALRWYRPAAEYGFLSAMLNLGDRYAEGRTVPQDYVRAHKWFNLAGSSAAASEEALRDRAIRARERVAAAMTPEQIAEAQRLAREWESSR